MPGKPRVIRTDIAVLFVGDEAEKQALLLGEPDLFFTTPGYDGWPLVMLRLPAVGRRPPAGAGHRRVADARPARPAAEPTLAERPLTGRLHDSNTP